MGGPLRLTDVGVLRELDVAKLPPNTRHQILQLSEGGRHLLSELSVHIMLRHASTRSKSKHLSAQNAVPAEANPSPQKTARAKEWERRDCKSALGGLWCSAGAVHGPVSGGAYGPCAAPRAPGNLVVGLATARQHGSGRKRKSISRSKSKRTGGGRGGNSQLSYSSGRLMSSGLRPLRFALQA